MSYRITDRRGRTIGYAHDRGAELLAAIVMGAVVIGLAIIIAPIMAIGYGVSLLIPWYLVFWNWASHLPITPFPNLNGVLTIAAVGIIGTLLVKYARLHLILLFGLFHILSLCLALILVVFWIGAIYLIIGISLGGLAFVVSWLFSWSTPSMMALGILVSPLYVLETRSWIWSAPLIFPIGWACAHLIGMFDKRSLFVTPSNLTLKAGWGFLQIALASWLGMFVTHTYFRLEDLLILGIGAVVGAMTWGIGKGLFFVLVRGVRTWEDVKSLNRAPT